MLLKLRLYGILDIDEHRSLIFFYYPILLKKLIEAKGHKKRKQKAWDVFSFMSI